MSVALFVVKLQHPVNESCTTRRFSSFCKAVNSLDRWRIKVTAGQSVPNMVALAQVTQGSKSRRNCHDRHWPQSKVNAWFENKRNQRTRIQIT